MRSLTRLGWALLNVLQAIFLCVWSAFWISAALVVLVVTMGRKLPLAMARTCWGPGLLRAAGAKLEVVGGEDVDFGKPHIFLMNHQSMIDIPVAFVALKCNLAFIAKRVLAFVPFLGWYMWAMGMVFVDRGNSAQAIASLKRAGERIRGGQSILAYPEGTRTRDGDVLPFKKGPFLVALEAGVPIVPVAIEGGHRVLARDGFRVRPGTIRVNVGKPIPTAGLTRDDRDALVKTVRDAIIDLHLAIGGKGGDRSTAIAEKGLEGIGRAVPLETAKPKSEDEVRARRTG